MRGKAKHTQAMGLDMVKSKHTWFCFEVIGEVIFGMWCSGTGSKLSFVYRIELVIELKKAAEDQFVDCVAVFDIT